MMAKQEREDRGIGRRKRREINTRNGCGSNRATLLVGMATKTVDANGPWWERHRARSGSERVGQHSGIEVLLLNFRGCLLLPTLLLQLRLIFGRIPRSCSLSDVLPRSGLEPCTEVPITTPDRPEAQSWIALETRDGGVRDVRVALPHHGQTVCPTRTLSQMTGTHSTAQTQPPCRL